MATRGVRVEPLVIDLALAACIHFKLGTPASYAEAFRLLAVVARGALALPE
jgi:hypothetical protein